VLAKAPLNDPTAVRAAPTMTISCRAMAALLVKPRPALPLAPFFQGIKPREGVKSSKCDAGLFTPMQGRPRRLAFAVFGGGRNA
jgi:hypothetical protein